MPAAFAALLLTSAVPAVATATVPAPTPVAAAVTEPDPKKMTQAQIRAHNAQLTKDHPFFIRCVRREDIGSLVKRNFSCRTNRQWRAAEDAANTEARAIADEMSSKSWRTSG